MATVFSVEAIASGQVPEAGAHAQAAQLVFEYFGRLAAEYDGQLDVLIYGSAARQAVDGCSSAQTSTPNARSDVDVLAVGNYLYGDRRRVKEDLSRIAVQTCVPVDAHLYTPDMLRRSSDAPHGDHIFVEHLRQAQQDSPLAIGDVTRNLRGISDYHPSERAGVAAAVIGRYLASKSNLFLSAMQYGNLNVWAIQSGLELPASLGRKVGLLLQLTGQLEGDVTTLLARSDAEEVLTRLAADDSQWEVATTLAGLNRRYDLLLGDARTGVISPDEYEYDLLEMQGEIYGSCLQVLAPALQMLERDFAYICAHDAA